MSEPALTDKNGMQITWLEAIIRSMEGLGHPATVPEIGDYMLSHVITDYPATAQTPLYSIHGIIYRHSKDSPAGLGNEHLFYATERGVWGLARWEH